MWVYVGIVMPVPSILMVTWKLTSVSRISQVTFKIVAKEGATLHPCNTKLSTYTGEAIKVIGTTDIRVTYDDQNISLPLLVTESDGPLLSGRNS